MADGNGQPDKHEIDPITEIIVNLNGAIDYMIGLRHERLTDKARIAELERRLAEQGAAT